MPSEPEQGVPRRRLQPFEDGAHVPLQAIDAAARPEPNTPSFLERFDHSTFPQHLVSGISQPGPPGLEQRIVTLIEAIQRESRRSMQRSEA